MKNISKYIVGSVGIALGLIAPVGAIAQGDNATIEEVIVTGRKREESLTDVPVSISVFNATALEDQGIDSQEDLFAATPGLDYGNWNGTRNAANPGVRGVQSDLRATNQQKVASFIDGLPMLGNQGSLQFTGIEQLEVFRGPQSAAFGRSTFAGAINYVTADAAEEFEGRVMLEGSDQGAQQYGVMLTGPIADGWGYRVSYVSDEFDGPDEWHATDGTLLGGESTEHIVAKLNFEFTDTIYGELMYNRLDILDQQGASWVIAEADCGAGSGVFRSSMGSVVEIPSAAWDCDVEIPSGGIGRNADVIGDFITNYNANIGDFEGSFGMMGFASLDTNTDGTLQVEEYLAQQFADGRTYEQGLEGLTTVEPGTARELDRIQGEINFEIGDGLLQVFAMSVEDSTLNWFENDNNGIPAAFAVNMMSMQVAVSGNVMSMYVPIEIEETYFETRWVSPDDRRLRYTLSASYYDYELQQVVYNNGGALWFDHIVEDAGHANFGLPVNPGAGISISEVAENIGASFGLNYDLTDRTTFSLEGRYQTDTICGSGTGAGDVPIELCSETTAFLPRIALNTTFTDSLSGYVQISKGNNPAGVNIAYQDPGNVQALSVAAGLIPVPALAANGITIPFNAGLTVDGAGGNPDPTVSFGPTTFTDFNEEVLTNYELGIKGSFADRRGAFTAALYFMDYKDIIGAENLNWDDNTDTVYVIPDDDTSGIAVQGGWNEGNWTVFTGERSWINQGDAEMYGVELTADYAVNDIWTVGGYVTLSSSKYVDYCSIQAPDYEDAAGDPITTVLTPAADGVLSDCSIVNGNWIPRQTPFTANFNVSASLPNDLFGLRTSVRADVRHKGSFFEDHLNLLEREAVTTVNVSANMRSDDWTVRLYMNNLTDNDDPARVYTSNGYLAPNASAALSPAATPGWGVSPTRPREVGLSVQYSF